MRGVTPRLQLVDPGPAPPERLDPPLRDPREPGILDPVAKRVFEVTWPEAAKRLEKELGR